MYVHVNIQLIFYSAGRIQGKSESLLLLSPSLSPGSVDCIIQPAIHISNESPAAVNNENCSYSSLKLLEGLGNLVVGGSASRGKTGNL
jgi:hypothetical protein